MIELQLLAGMRPGEVRLMRGCELDTTVWTYTPETHRTEHHGIHRTIHIAPRAQNILKPFLRPDVTAALFSPAEGDWAAFSAEGDWATFSAEGDWAAEAPRRRIATFFGMHPCNSTSAFYSLPT